MPIGIGNPTGILPAFTYVPGSGPTGVVKAPGIGSGGGIPTPVVLQPKGIMPVPDTMPDRGLAPLSRVAQVVRGRIEQSVMPPVPDGGGLISEMTSRVKSMDIVSGRDRMLGKTKTIMPGTRKAQSQRITGNFSTRSVLGPVSGRMARAYV